MKTDKTTARVIDLEHQKLRHEADPGMPLVDVALLIILVLNLVLVPMALFAMGEDKGVISSIKYILVGFGAAAATYGINRFSIDRLAPLHAIGYQIAGVVAVSAILLTGSGTALASFTGIVFQSVEAKIQQEHAVSLTEHVTAANEVVLVTERLAPTTIAIQDDIAQTIACEISSACLSETIPGEGQMTRSLQTAGARAASIANAIAAGQDDRVRRLDTLNRLTAAFYDELADTGLSVAERRSKLQSLHAEIVQNVGALREAMPTAVLVSYAQDLQSGATLPGDVDGSRKLSAYLTKHGNTLADQLSDLPDDITTAPQFPDRPGMLDVMRYITTYLAIAAVVIVGELVLPITLYLMTYLRLSWEIERRETGPKIIAKKDPFDGLFDNLDDGDDQ